MVYLNQKLTSTSNSTDILQPASPVRPFAPHHQSNSITTNDSRLASHPSVIETLVQRSASPSQQDAYFIRQESGRSTIQATPSKLLTVLHEHPPIHEGLGNIIQRVGKPKNVRYDPDHDHGGAGTAHMEVPLDGKIHDEGHNSPTDQAKSEIPGQSELENAGQLNRMYAMHLLNGRLGGSGNTSENLAWGLHKHNREHSRQWEIYAQTDAKNPNNCGKTMEMDVTATYHSGGALSWHPYCLEKLTCSYNIPGGTVSLPGPQDITVAGITDYGDQEYDPNKPAPMEDVEMQPPGVKTFVDLNVGDILPPGSRRSSKPNPKYTGGVIRSRYSQRAGTRDDKYLPSNNGS